MNDILDYKKPEPEIDENNFLFKLFSTPRKVFEYIDQSQTQRFLYAILFITGVAKSLDRASLKNFGDEYSLTFILGSSLVFGGLFGWIGLYLYSALMYWTGELIDGKAESTQSIFRTIGYAAFPSFLAFIPLLIQIFFLGNDVFTSADYTFDLSSIVSIGLVLLSILQLLLGIYSFVLIVIGLSVVQQFSIGKAILNLLFPIVGIMLFVLTIILFISLFFG